LDQDFSRLPFAQAAKVWLGIRQRGNLKARTHETNANYIEALGRFFGPVRLCDITAGNVRTYQIARQGNVLEVDGEITHPWKRRAGNSIINHEISCLALIMQGKTHKRQESRGKLWAKIQPLYSPLPIPSWSPRDVLTEEDEEQLFTVAASHPEAALAYWVACITNNTTASGIELRGLRLKNIMLRDHKEISEIYIPPDAVKNNSRPRKIALNRTARWAVEQCYKRALECGSCQPEHYLFSFRVRRNTWDPARPASRWFLRKSWDKLREATGFRNLNPHDLRHQCITRMLENGVLPATVRAIAGHVTEQMMNYYSHIRREAKYDAVMAIELEEQKRKKAGPQPGRRYA
jgi:integrase